MAVCGSPGTFSHAHEGNNMKFIVGCLTFVLVLAGCGAKSAIGVQRSSGPCGNTEISSGPKAPAKIRVRVQRKLESSAGSSARSMSTFVCAEHSRQPALPPNRAVTPSSGILPSRHHRPQEKSNSDRVSRTAFSSAFFSSLVLRFLSLFSDFT